MFVALSAVASFLFWCLVERFLSQRKGTVPTIIFSIVMLVGISLGIYAEIMSAQPRGWEFPTNYRAIQQLRFP